MTRSRRLPPGPALATVAVVLLPYAAVGLPHRPSLWAQASLILAAVAILLVAGLARPGAVRRVAGADRALVVATAAYAVAAAAGAAVGVLRGNDTVLIAGQLLAMGLLPAAALAAAAFRDRERRSFWAAVAAATGIAAAVHLAVGSARLATGQPLDRLAIGGGFAATAVVPLGFFAAVQMTRDGDRLRRRVGSTIAAVTAVYVVGSGTRSLWIALVAGAAAFAVAAPIHLRVSRRTAVAVVAAAAVSTAGIATAAWWLDRPRPNVLPADFLARQGPDPRPRVRVGPAVGAPGTVVAWTPRGKDDTTTLPLNVPVAAPGSYRFRCWVRGRGSEAFVALQWAGGDGVKRASWTGILHGSASWRQLDLVGEKPDDADRVRLVLGGEGGSWQLRMPRLEHLGPSPLAAAVVDAGLRLSTRLRSAVTWTSPATGALDPTVAMRLGESRALWESFAGATLPAKLLGHGLGATFAFDTVAPDDAGVWRPRSRPNYIHNAYMFLLYKLGIVGTLLVLGAAATWLLRPWAQRRRLPDGAAATAVWVTVLTWSVACPELIDFRVAPLLGLLVAATAVRPNAPGGVSRSAPPGADPR